MRAQAAIHAINRHGILLVYPVANGKDPVSLWQVAYPRSQMSWEWDESGDDRVARMWHLREELSRSKKVIYTKWYQGRATFFSRDAFRAVYASMNTDPPPLSKDARALLAILEESSPLSTKELKRETGLQGRLLESTYQRAMKELWQRLLIVGFGEIDEGAFPSLAIGSSRLLFEQDVMAAEEMRPQEAKEQALAFIKRSPKLMRFYERNSRQLIHRKPSAGSASHPSQK